VHSRVVDFRILPRRRVVRIKSEPARRSKALAADPISMKIHMVGGRGAVFPHRYSSVCTGLPTRNTRSRVWRWSASPRLILPRCSTGTFVIGACCSSGHLRRMQC
jgi:hypothetical protein